MVDVTPGVNAEKAKAVIDFVDGSQSFESFDESGARDAAATRALGVVAAAGHPPQCRAVGRRVLAMALRPGQPGSGRGDHTNPHQRRR